MSVWRLTTDVVQRPLHRHLMLMTTRSRTTSQRHVLTCCYSLSTHAPTPWNTCDLVQSTFRRHLTATWQPCLADGCLPAPHHQHHHLTRFCQSKINSSENLLTAHFSAAFFCMCSLHFSWSVATHGCESWYRGWEMCEVLRDDSLQTSSDSQLDRETVEYFVAVRFA